MKKLVVNIVVLVAVLFVARSMLNGFLDVRLMKHFNECNAELDIAHKMHGPRDEQRDELFKRYQQCVKDKGTFVDNFLREGAIAQLIEAMKE